MKFKCAVVGLTLMSLAGCSHQNELAEMPTKEASLAIQLAAVSAQQELTGKKTNGSVYFDCMLGHFDHGLNKKQCIKVFNTMVTKIDNQPGLSNVTFKDLTNKDFFKTIYDDYQDVMFNWLG